jgi:hypothetical protein
MEIMTSPSFDDNELSDPFMALCLTQLPDCFLVGAAVF